jgi:polysaccharide deacetylase 2 family uncharacterized protein YibQ
MPPEWQLPLSGGIFFNLFVISVHPESGKDQILARRRKTARNRRMKSGKRNSLMIALVITIIVILGAIFLFEKLKNTALEKAVTIPKTVEKLKMPQRPAEQPVGMEGYSRAIALPHGVKSTGKRSEIRHGTVAIIVDDMGSSMHEADALLAIDVPLTFSIIPGLAKGREVAETAHRKGRQVMLHIPMEPKGYQQKPFEKNGLLLAMSDEEIEKRMVGYLGAVPYAVGANNHMGSRFTEDRPKMLTVLKILKEKGLFFIDSKTTPSSVGDKLAREMGIPAAARNIFLDNDADVGAIKAQIEKLAGMAKKTGSAIGICHPHKTTLQALTATLPVLKKEGITFVYASALVK